MEKDTKELTKEDLLNPDFIPSIFENYKDKENLAYISQEEQNEILSRNQELSSDDSFIM